VLENAAHICVIIYHVILSRLVGSTRDEEPLVDARINWGRSKVFVGWDVWELIWGNTAWRLLHSQVGAIKVVSMYIRCCKF